MISNQKVEPTWTTPVDSVKVGFPSGSLWTFGASHILDHEHRRTELSRNGF
jgi:hypothetical protein